MSTPINTAPPHKSRIRWLVLGVVIVVAIAVIAVMAAALGGDSTSTVKSPASNSQQHDTGSGSSSQQAPHPPPANDEQNDVKSLRFDDKSSYGVADIWADYTITNDSSKASDYEVAYSVTNDATGERVEHSYIFEEDVQPGQTVTGETPLTVSTTQGYTLHVTHVDRTETIQ